MDARSGLGTTKVDARDAADVVGERLRRMLNGP
jgi:hypothetical protein